MTEIGGKVVKITRGKVDKGKCYTTTQRRQQNIDSKHSI